MTRRSPVFHVDGERGLRGGERQLLYLAAALKAHERSGMIWCRADAPLQDEARRLGLETRSLPFLGEADVYSARLLARAAKREGAILHAHTAHAAGLCALASLWGAPWIAHRRVDFPVGRFSARWKYGRARKVIAVSEAIARLLRGAGIPAQKIAVIGDALPINEEECSWAGIPPNAWRAPSHAEKQALRERLSVELGLDPAVPWIGNLAALVPHKDQRTLVAASALVLRARPDVRVLIAGEGPERTRLQAAIEARRLGGKVLLLGQRRDAPDLLKALDVYVQSSWGEGMGSVLLEAMSCGVPVAATEAGGIPELVENGASGLLAPARDPEALADAVLRLLEARGLAARLAGEALRRLPAFGLAAMAERMDAVYAELDTARSKYARLRLR